MKNIKEAVHPWFNREIQVEIRDIQTYFDGFEWWIIQKLVDVQSQNPSSVHEKLVALRATIKHIHARPFPNMPIIEEISKEEVLDT